MKKNMKRILVFCLAVVMLISSVTTVIAATIYYYFGYYYTYINSDMVSLCGIDPDELDVAFVPDTLNKLKLVDISNSAFMNNTDIRLIDFGGATNLERIGSFAFSGCTNVTGGVSIPSNVVVIEIAAFQNCTSLEYVVYNATCGYVPNQCFKGCSTLNSVTLNDSVASIGSYAFANCPNLSYLEIPASVTSIANSAFQNDNITLGVYYNSTAHQYALNKGIEYVILDPENVPTEPPTEPETEEPETEAPVTELPTQAPETLPPVALGYYLGDVDCNDNVESIDMTFIQRYLADLQYPAVCDFSHADIDGDDDVTIIDVTLIDRFLAMFDVPYPVGTWIETV